MLCLIKSQVESFREKLKSREIDPDKLASMTSQERREFFAPIVGETNARQVNALFENKLLLKNQKKGFITWAKTVAGVKPEARRDLVARIKKMDTVLHPQTADAFLEDLVAQRFGTHVSLEEAGRIAELAKNVSEKEQALKNGGDRLEYGRAVVALNKYVNALKEGSRNLTLAEKVAEGVSATKGMRASLDNSYIGRQGIKAMWTHPTIWAKHAAASFKRMVQQFGGKEVMDEVNADIVSRENYRNGRYKKMGLAVSRLEEEFPTTLPEKLPGYRRLYKASEAAFNSQAYLTRADLADLYLQKAEADGVDLNNEKEIKPIGSLVNTLTGRGFGGSSGSSKIEKVVNATFFSPRYLASNVRTLTDPLTAGSSFTRKQAAINLIKIVSGTAAVMATASALKKDSVEWDPRSSDFGKIKVGSTRFDITGGLASIVTLVSRLVTMSSKSSTTGVIKKLNTGEFGAQTGWEVLIDFGENKLSPLAGVLRDYLKGETFSGEKPQLWKEGASLVTPIGFENAAELLKAPDGAPFLATLVLDGLGFGQNTYAPKTNWNQNPGAELLAFRDKIGAAKFQAANDLFNERFNQWFVDARKKSDFQKLTDEEQQKVISNKKDEFKQQIFKENGFKYKKKKPKKLPKF